MTAVSTETPISSAKTDLALLNQARKQDAPFNRNLRSFHAIAAAQRVFSLPHFLG